MDFTNYIHPELLILVPVIYMIGWALKKAFPDMKKKLPLMLMFIGVALSASWVLGMAYLNSSNAFTVIFTAATQGVLVTATAVLVHELFKKKHD